MVFLLPLGHKLHLFGFVFCKLFLAVHIDWHARMRAELPQTKSA
jgi:hypothetical protein